MKLTLHAFDLRLAHTFTIARGSIEVQPTLIVELEQDGQHGYGEATTNDYYGATLANMSAALAGVKGALTTYTLRDDNDPAWLWSELAPQLAAHPFAQCALDQAAWDLFGKLQGQPVWQLWGEKLTNSLPRSNYTIGIAEIPTMVAKMQEFADWPIYKIKLGTPHDLEIVRELRKHTSATFRVDANCGWTADETLRNAEALAALDVEFIEQPLPANRWEDMRRVKAESALPIMADESCQIESDVAKCGGHFHGVNIKLVKCGGLTPARRMIAEARELGLKVMVGCMTESTVGISAIAQLLPQLDYVDMDGAVLLAEDIASGVRVERGECIFPSVKGSGVELLLRA
jgi:L-alanine-DL-glutamate epimerase-like enolase superfamily enzyme